MACCKDGNKQFDPHNTSYYMATLIQNYWTYWGVNKLVDSLYTFQTYFLQWNIWISIKISMNSVPYCPTDNGWASVRLRVWRQTSDKPLSESMLAKITDAVTMNYVIWNLIAKHNLAIAITPNLTSGPEKSQPNHFYTSLDTDILSLTYIHTQRENIEKQSQHHKPRNTLSDRKQWILRFQRHYCSEGTFCRVVGVWEDWEKYPYGSHWLTDIQTVYIEFNIVYQLMLNKTRD